MRFDLPTEPISLAHYLSELMDLIGLDRWLKRADQLADEMERSLYLHKIVADYHWLEMNICHQWQLFSQEGRVDFHEQPHRNLASLNFAAAVVEIHRRLGETGKSVLTGRIRDALKAETGFAALYLEVSLAQRLMTWGFDVELPDMEGKERFDLLIHREGFSAEVECKSQSADAGRQIHRKNFYRFMASLNVEYTHERPQRQEILLVTLSKRLDPDFASQALLGNALKSVAESQVTSQRGSGFEIRRILFDDISGVEKNLREPQALKAILNKSFGENLHVASWQISGNYYLIVMRSAKQDDTSFPALEAMRSGAKQLSGKRPGFLAVQHHGIEPADLYLPHFQRKMFMLSGALFGHYKAHHVNAVYITGYGAVVDRQRVLHTPCFAITNTEAKHPIPKLHAAALLKGILQEQPPVDPTPI